MTEKNFIEQVRDGEIPQFTIDPNSHLFKYHWMSIYAEPGTSVMYTGCNGTDYDKKYADEYLKVGSWYTVNEIEVGGWSSSVQFDEVPGKWFNTVHFATGEVK